jgi:drug/metabolite transporter (DMT)-like permease
VVRSMPHDDASAGVETLGPQYFRGFWRPNPRRLLIRESLAPDPVPLFLTGLLALGGLVVIAGDGGRGSTIGDLCVTAGVLSASLYSIAAKRFDDGSDALSLTTWQFSAATIVALSVAGLGWIATGHHPRTDAAPRYWLAAVAVGAIGLAFSFLIYNKVLSRVDAGWTAIVLNLIPVFGLLSAISLLGEKLSRASGIGALLVGASVIYFTICDQRGSHGTVDAPRLITASREQPAP